MPPASIPGGPQYPMPTPADVSVLYGWIQACFSGAGAGYDTSGGFYGPGYEDGGAGGGGLDAGSHVDAAPDAAHDAAGD